LAKKVRGTASRTRVLESLEKEPSDFYTLLKKLDGKPDTLANELYNLLNAGYVTKTNNVFHLADRGREYLKVERGETRA